MLRVNARVIRLALTGRRLTPAHVADGYDDVAEVYAGNWLPHLTGVTDELVRALPDLPPGRRLDLGCGTGYAAVALSRKFGDSDQVALDISPAMLAEASTALERAGVTKTRTVEGDMLRHLRAQPSGSLALVFSGWAIGYSNPASIAREAFRVLGDDGVYAFVVNCLDTLGPVFRAFRRTMFAFPGAIDLAAFPLFPRGLAQGTRQVKRAGFKVTHSAEGKVRISPPADSDVMEWLLGTGVLAGFDRMLPIRTGEEVREFFAAELKRDAAPIEHHYIVVIGRKAP